MVQSGYRAGYRTRRVPLSYEVEVNGQIWRRHADQHVGQGLEEERVQLQGLLGPVIKAAHILSKRGRAFCRHTSDGS